METMNKQEAIDELKKYKVGFGEAAAVRFDRIVSVINQIHEPQKVVVPKFIADSIEYCKNKEGYGLLRAMDYCDEYNDTGEWLEHNQETFALAWLFGYEIEQEKLYTVELFNGQPLVEEKNILYFSSDLAASNAHVGKDKLEAAGFGWVFDCNGVKVVEVKND
ncbi:DUF1642 domain-containing protein [Streptococcus suis]|nr:DUF1642 domain-containing protein [Streptococcus suis]